MLMLIGGLIVAYFVYILISRNNDKPSSDPPAMAYVALREIIERAAEEAKKLPGLSASVDIGHSHEHSPIAEHSYEDLLATAIFNKF
ncbi:uncharacterized protein LOC109862188 isoform X2 [Pseudomyrmex gracilis]|uniref:uncharacterized protein LOC109862188 isoform X2 n=1 Tax=Pseudomyrmex gracilis TaxID=219809 RepID=UPI000995D94F|nr:uncharacterized protein LOC109862188 isoform X2 [Pseudomyrmex gracilis]